MLEAELKASLGCLTAEELADRAAALGFLPEELVRETDVYFNGTDRDFRRTDEALRLRSVRRLPDGPRKSLMTYKGPKVDRVSNARTEYETAVSDSDTAQKLLEALGYRPLAVVDKVRRTYRLGEVTLCLDEVTDLGSFLELELLVSGEAQRAAAVARLLALLEALGVSRERLSRRSYLELLAEKRQGGWR
jgi:adenylate cyclase class 2